MGEDELSVLKLYDMVFESYSFKVIGMAKNGLFLI